jgi:superfamily I DNA/RNA helicase
MLIEINKIKIEKRIRKQYGDIDGLANSIKELGLLNPPVVTPHASKGLEFNNVFLIGIEDGKFPHERSELIDEARLFYVGVTRPKENLNISQIGSDNKFVEEYLN